MRDLTSVFCIETPLNYYLMQYAQTFNVRSYIHVNYEFCDYLNHDLPLPTKFIMPSRWKLQEMQKIYKDRVVFLPPPINPKEFEKPRQKNIVRDPKSKKRFLHTVGTLAHLDRNGTLLLTASLQQSRSDFDLIIRSQAPLPTEYIINDKRVTYIVGDIDTVSDIYYDFDALILPRRYGGLCLPCNEALMSGMIAVMTDISPNNSLLPKKWLVPARKTHTFKARDTIDVFSADVRALAKMIDSLATRDLTKEKKEAYEIGYKEFAEINLVWKYKELCT